MQHMYNMAFTAFRLRLLLMKWVIVNMCSQTKSVIPTLSSSVRVSYMELWEYYEGRSERKIVKFDHVSIMCSKPESVLLMPSSVRMISVESSDHRLVL